MNLPRFYSAKVVVITGSARGIGREAARQALAAGARVVINGRDGAAVRETARALGVPDRTLGIAADVSTPEGADRLVAAILAAWGRVDVLINNAGLSMRGAFGDLDPATVRTMVDANLLTAVWTTKAALPALRQTGGRVVFVSSLAGVRGFPGVSLYSASKMALAALCQAVRAEEGPRGVGAGLVYLAFTENDPGKTVLGADGHPFRHERKWSMTQGAAARALLVAAARGRARTVLTAGGRALAWVQGWFPGLMDGVLPLFQGRIHAVGRKDPP
jgi:NAD(P)-dependent dehydrogenase (short-subunit alcohol dehydrogenase family)